MKEEITLIMLYHALAKAQNVKKDIANASRMELDVQKIVLAESAKTEV